jgi:hypothetical protein
MIIKLRVILKAARGKGDFGQAKKFKNWGKTQD